MTGKKTEQVSASSSKVVDESIEPTFSTKWLFLGGLCINALLLYNFPAMEEEQKAKLFRFPKNGDELREMNQVIIYYKEDHFWLVILAYISIYINFQSFAVPGTSYLAILSGPIFGAIPGFCMSHGCAVVGACLCFTISKKLGAGFVKQRMPEKLAWLQRKIDENKSNLFYYFLFLRLTPIVPNWFLNASSAVVGVPFWIFFSTSLVGLMPYSFILIKMGLMLDEVSQIGFDFNHILTLFGLAFLSLIPTFLTKKEDKMDVEEDSSKSISKTEKTV